ncbi:hypothetical protein OS493_037972 [Desmophyllum pertusum]|uniref:Uncharacterized protein n=1 Tax=Desmophyllum pertusum TaxID=174260 RepID=A0A9X0D845_9CNID|nr:hypothetical protein OS493_037972 [Desmophyllum pertusum]
MKKNSRKKTKAVILETDSEGEEDDSASVGANCDSSRREKIKSTELEERPHDGRSDECKGLHVTTKKNSWKRTKAVILKKESKREQDDGASVKLEVETKEDEEVVISCSKKGKYNARIYDKRHSCFYCDKLCAKIARHYEHHHEHEAEVAEAFAYPRGSKDRRKALEKFATARQFSS